MKSEWIAGIDVGNLATPDVQEVSTLESTVALERALRSTAQAELTALKFLG
ncbi:MAG: hypothetical protein AAF991_06070 [Pseudomonadota bacterium]